MATSGVQQSNPDDDRIALIEANKRPRATVFGPPAPKRPQVDSSGDDDGR